VFVTQRVQCNEDGPVSNGAYRGLRRTGSGLMESIVSESRSGTLNASGRKYMYSGISSP
jgi:hypothetical protein